MKVNLGPNSAKCASVYYQVGIKMIIHPCELGRGPISFQAFQLALCLRGSLRGGTIFL